VHPTFKVPLNALFLICFINFLLSLINIGSSVAYNAVISLCTLGIMLSYILPISFFLMKKLNGSTIEYGPFSLGRWGIPVNLFALFFATFEVIWTPWPPVPEITAQTMNYAGPILIAIVILAVADWTFGGRKRFDVPIARHVPLFYS
jgi:choline transport protein